MKNTIIKAMASISIPLLLISVSLLVFLFSKGYRLDFDNGEIQKTGMISISSNPKRADIYLNDKNSGKTSKSISGIIPGMHNLKISKDKYYTWSINVNIKEEQTAILSPTLYFKDPSFEKIYPDNTETGSQDNEENNENTNLETTQPQISQIFTDDINETIAYTILKNNNTRGNTDESTEINEAQEPQAPVLTEDILELWTYPVNRSFWQFNISPQKISEFSSNDYQLNSFKLTFSPNNQWILLSINNNTDDSDEEMETTFLLLESNETNQTPLQLEELSSNERFTPTWAQNSQNIIYSKNNELRSLNIETNAQHVLKEFESEDSIVWTSDSSGYIYITENNLENKTYTISRMRITGEGKTSLIDANTITPENNDLDAQENQDYINNIEISSEYLLAISQNYIHIHPIKDEQRISYRVNNATFLEFSPKEDKFLYYSKESLNSYTLEIDEGDPIHKVGNKALIDLTENVIENPKWSTNNKDVFYILIETDEDPESKNLNVITLDGKNDFPLIEGLITNSYSVGNSGKYILTLDEESSLGRFTLHE